MANATSSFQSLHPVPVSLRVLQLRQMNEGLGHSKHYGIWNNRNTCLSLGHKHWHCNDVQQ